MIISKIFKFDSAHRLENYNGACEKLHGHTYKLIVSCSGEINPETGMIIDFNELKKIVDEKVLSKIDHAYLNDIVKNPTCENMLFWIKEQLKSEQKLKLKKLVLYETDTSFCELEC